MHFLTSLGCAIRKPSLKQTHFNENLRKKLGIAGPLMVDSGGFALMKAPKAKWTTRDVAQLISGIDADLFVSLDYPPSPCDAATDRIRKIERSARSYNTLIGRLPGKTIMPVVHGRTLREVERSIQLILRYGTDIRWVGLGGIVPLLQHRVVSKEVSTLGAEVFIALALSKMRAAFPSAKLHAFGAGGTRTFPAIYALGADSADSIGWRQAAGFGSIFLPLKSQRAIIWNLKKPPPRKLLGDAELALLASCECPVCCSHESIEARLQTMRSGFEFLSIHNAWTVANQFRYWPRRGRSQMAARIGDGLSGPSWAKAVNLIARHQAPSV